MLLQRGERVDVVHRRQHQDALRARHRHERLGDRRAHHGLNTAGALRRGSPSASPSSRCCRCRWLFGDTTSGRSGTGSSAVAADPRQVVGADVDLRLDHLPQALELPVGHVPTHRDRHRADLPRRQHAEHELGRVADARARPGRRSPTPRAASAAATWLERRSSSAHVTDASRAVHRQVHVRDLVGTLLRQFLQPIGVAPVSALMLSPSLSAHPSARPPWAAQGLPRADTGDTIRSRRRVMVPESDAEATRARDGTVVTIIRVRTVMPGASLPVHAGRLHDLAGVAL